MTRSKFDFYVSIYLEKIYAFFITTRNNECSMIKKSPGIKYFRSDFVPMWRELRLWADSHG